MKFLAFLIFATIIAIIHSAPTQISDNNVGDIINVDISADVDVQTSVDVTVFNMILSWINKELGFVRLDEDGNVIPPNLPWKEEKSE